MIWLGVDPGKSGGLASIDDKGHTEAFPMPIAGGEIAAHALGVWACGHTIRHDSSVLAIVEKVHAMPKQGVSSTFTFGVGYGKVLGVLGALGIRTHLVSPPAWKKLILADLPHDKDGAIAWCNRAFPRQALVLPGCRKPHDGMADALCLAEWGRRTLK
jgi:crossover junction endodeoxyribonuclease RuvC